ncbi:MULTISPECIES: hypothetical protein [unclassified Isoptericola]|uniref:hypothetical protein n=1 Tax=unclassified Isoptericola TaxID=2623355 RepID=UPI0027132BDE|nr:MULTISPECIES: hypothetical protein [unclassified Isoptericola]MDO8145628.1 hypothetical protein [Isoptericola sp. 178]MDO8149176.1 hypothetical protein [Isoptericola sp. b515]
MNARSTRRRTAAASIGLSLLAAAGVPTLAAAADPAGDDSIDISVDIEDLTPAGELSMSVAANDGVALVEEGSDDTARQFVGTTPTVTVTDTRSPEEVPDGSYWAVVGQAGDFVEGSDATQTFGPEHLGWEPRLLTPSSTGLVAEGEPVSSVVDDGTGAAAVGLEGQELLVSTFSAAEEIGTWDVEAGLTLRTPADIPAGSYTSTLTLTLFEQS